MRRIVGSGVLVAFVTVAPAWSAVLCTKKSGVVVRRDAACKRKETQLDLTQFGALGPKGDPGSPGSPGSPDSADQVRAKFFTGTDCPGNDATDVMIRVGSICVDVFEASVWSTASGGTQFGVSSDDYPCNNNGNDCTAIFARSVAGVTPSAFLTWFQAQQACTNAGKRLLTSAEWQAAAAGTPDPGAAGNGLTECNTNSGTTVPAGSVANCVSVHGVRDMVGNLTEWVSDWLPLTAGIGPGWGAFSDDFMGVTGGTTSDGPAAVFRGGSRFDGTGAGVFAVSGYQPPDASFVDLGFRCAR
jgi:hypothetical protein